MVALFSTLLNSSNTANESSSSSIPTVIQLYASSPPLLLDSKKKLAGHAILSYQAVEVSAASAESDQDSTLFGRARKSNASSSNIVESPNLGVWNAKVLPSSATASNSNALVDSLLKIPLSPYYCMTISLADPSQVEPEMTRMQEALVRYLIACPPKTSEKGTTSLYQLRDVQFGLAPEDTPPTTTAAPDESDRNVLVNVMVCAVVPVSSSSSTDYQETQAQNLVMYHLRRFAAAIGATLVFCSTTSVTDKSNAAPEDVDEAKDAPQQATLTMHQLGNVWREFAQGKDMSSSPTTTTTNTTDNEDTHESTAIYVPHDEQELIETVLLRNANNPPAWDSSKDSLWKALPTEKSDTAERDTKTSTATGDNAWLQQLRDSLGTAVEPAAAAAAATPTTPKTEDAEVSSFFENLLKK